MVKFELCSILLLACGMLTNHGHMAGDNFSYTPQRRLTHTINIRYYDDGTCANS